MKNKVKEILDSIDRLQDEIDFLTTNVLVFTFSSGISIISVIGFIEYHHIAINNLNLFYQILLHCYLAVCGAYMGLKCTIGLGKAMEK